MEQIMTMGKKFLIIGNMNSIICKEIFPYIKDNKMWLGYRNLGADMFFHITDEYKKEIVNDKKEGSGWKEIDGEICGRVASACWFTNLEHSKRKELIGLTKKYNPTDYPKYDNYDAIFVKEVVDIPKDYDGVMGVPLTFLGKYNPNQFEILDVINRYMVYDYFGVNEDVRSRHSHCANVGGKATYARILIRKVKELPTEEEKVTMEQIMSMGKKFIIVGNHSAITYKEIFPYLKDNKMWLGYKPLGGEMYFHITDEYKEEIVKTKKEGTGWVEIDGEVMARVTQACWFTNLEYSKRKAFIGLTRKYNPTDYPKYDDYDAINVDWVSDIPKDYDGIIGVPISFMGKYNPNQFELIGIDRYVEDNQNKGHRFHINGKEMTARLLIRKVKELPTEEEVKNIF